MDVLIELLYDYLEEPSAENKSKIMLELLECNLSHEDLEMYNEFLNNEMNVIRFIKDIKKNEII